MTNHTDTNQASEELESKVTEIVAMIPMFTGAKLNEIGWEKYGENEKDAIAKLLELICTEKLKLLAEVRERVVGEDDYQPGNPAPDLVEHNQLVRDGLRFEQRTALNKLEAEL